MSAFDVKEGKQDIIEIHGPSWDAHEFCTARTIVRSGDEEWVMNQQMSIQPKGGNRKQRRAGGFQKQSADGIDIKSQLGATNRLWVQKMLESWTFTMNGLPMLFEKSGQGNELADRRMGKIMQMLDQSYVDYIYEQIQAAQPKEAQEEEDEEEDEEGSAFFESALPSIATEMSAQEEAEAYEEMILGMRTSRNFLSKS